MLVGEQDGIAVSLSFMVVGHHPVPTNTAHAAFTRKTRDSSPYLNGIGMNHAPYLAGDIVPLERTLSRDRLHVSENGPLPAMPSSKRRDSWRDGRSSSGGEAS